MCPVFVVRFYFTVYGSSFRLRFLAPLFKYGFQVRLWVHLWVLFSSPVFKSGFGIRLSGMVSGFGFWVRFPGLVLGPVFGSVFRSCFVLGFQVRFSVRFSSKVIGSGFGVLL